jgi:hypothetical protein
MVATRSADRGLERHEVEPWVAADGVRRRPDPIVMALALPLLIAAATIGAASGRPPGTGEEVSCTIDAVVERGTGYGLREGAVEFEAFRRNRPTASPQAPRNF